MRNVFERYPFFLLLLPTFVVIHLGREFNPVINYVFVYDRIIIFFIVPVVLFSLIYLITRSFKKSALSAFILLIPFFYTGDLKNWLSAEFPGSAWQRYSFILIALLILTITSLYLVKKSKSDFRKQFLTINAVLILFIMADIFLMVLNASASKYKLENEPALTENLCDSCEKPDIYYIVFDTYTSSRTLKSNFNYQNDLLEEDLKNKGFFIAEDSKSNYSYTAFSIGSTLNMDYIHNADTTEKIFDREYLQALKLVYDNRFWQILKKEGYHAYNFSLFDFRSNPSAINNSDNWGFRELFDQYNLFLKLKMDIGYHLPDWLENLMGENKYFINDPENRNEIPVLIRQHLAETIQSKTVKPKFVYAHFLRPHPPYAFDSLDNNLDMAITSNEEAYIHQIAYCNRIIKEVTDSILATAKRPLVIIIQGDHGTPFTNELEPIKKLDNLNAIYFSNKDYRLLHDSMTNVNTFRIVLNTFFQKNLPLLPDKFYVFKN